MSVGFALSNRGLEGSVLVSVWLLQERCGTWNVKHHDLLVYEVLEQALLGPPCAQAIADDDRLGTVLLLERLAHEAANFDVAPSFLLAPDSKSSCNVLVIRTINNTHNNTNKNNNTDSTNITIKKRLTITIIRTIIKIVLI